MSATLELARQLIRQPSITPDDCNCQAIITEHLKTSGFQPQVMPFGDVTNLWLRRGTQAPLLVFAGHTDVVPPGPLQQWQSPPFEPTIRGANLYGRGAADMKSSLAAIATACKNFVRRYPHHSGSIALLLTSDEEGPAINGTAKVIEQLQAHETKIDWCLVGEPTGTATLGDTLKIGRRGSLSASLRITGLQGHVAYPHLAVNPIHQFAPALAELTALDWDTGNERFTATRLQVSNLNAGTGANNVIPGTLTTEFNLRFSDAITVDEIKTKVEQVLKNHHLDYEIDWHLSGNPFYCLPGELVRACEAAIYETMNIRPKLSTGGGTSDGRFIAPTGAQVVELGPVNESIHKANEHIDIEALDQLATIYEKIMKQLLI